MKTKGWIFLALAVVSACQKAEEDFVAEKPKALEGPYTLTLEATKGEDTKALELINSGSTLTALWRDGETVAVYQGGTYLGQLAATADGTDNTKATLSGTLESVAGVANNAVLTLLFPRKDWDYTGQDGGAPNDVSKIDRLYDYATANVTVASVDTGNKTITTTSGAAFENQQSIYRFGFKVNDTALSVKEFTVSSNHNKLVTSRSYSSGWISTYGNLTVRPSSATSGLLYLSLRNENANTSEPDKFSFFVIGNDDALYLGEKDIPGDKLGNGKFISAQNIAVTKSNLAHSGTATVVW
jgi:hypothetical protein